MEQHKCKDDGLAPVGAEPKIGGLDEFFALAKEAGITHMTADMARAIAKRSDEIASESHAQVVPAEPVAWSIEKIGDRIHHVLKAHYGYHYQTIRPKVFDDLMEAISPLAAPAASELAESDASLLDFIRDESLSVEPFDMPTGAGDADIGWRVIQNHEEKPAKRVASEVYFDDPRQAIREARERLARDAYCIGPLHLESDDSEPASAPSAPIATPQARDWPEDFAHENGQYMNTCHACRLTFIGYKRRGTCKLCAVAPIEPIPPVAPWAGETLDFMLGSAAPAEPTAEMSDEAIDMMLARCMVAEDYEAMRAIVRAAMKVIAK